VENEAKSKKEESVIVKPRRERFNNKRFVLNFGKTTRAAFKESKPWSNEVKRSEPRNRVATDKWSLKNRKTNCSLEFVLWAIGAFVNVYSERVVGKKENFTNFVDVGRIAETLRK